MACKSVVRACALRILLSVSACPEAQALDLKPKPFPLTIMGVRVEVPVALSFDAKTDGDQLLANVRAEGSLKGVQAAALAIVRAIPMPEDNCARDGLNPVVNSVDAASLAPDGGSADLSISGHVTAWACKHVLGNAIKTKVSPRVDVTISAPVKLVVVDASHVGAALSGPVSVSGSGLAGEALSLLARYFESRITEQLQNALDATEARASFPAVPGLSVTIRDASFGAGQGGDLVVRASGSAAMTSDAFNRLLDRMNR